MKTDATHKGRRVRYVRHIGLRFAEVQTLAGNVVTVRLADLRFDK